MTLLTDEPRPQDRHPRRGSRGVVGKSDSPRNAPGTVIRQDDSVACYSGRVHIGSYLETGSGILVTDAFGRVIGTVGKRSEAQWLLWDAHAGGHRP